MNGILSRRLPRDLKENIWRWSALFLMIALGMYIVVSVVGAAENVITGSRAEAEKNHVEDGEFSTFIPLTEEQENILRDMGITLEQKFSIDIKLDDGSVLRIMRNRERINLIAADSGRIAESLGESVLEKRYSAEHNYSVGDSIKIAETVFEIVGIGTTPDYDLPVGKLSDMSAESSLFGTAFVTAEQYELLKNGVEITEDYTYAYRLNNTVTREQLKQAVKDLEFDYENVTDKFFRESAAEYLDKKEALKNGIKEISDGAAALSGTLSALYENGALSVTAPEYITGVGAALEGSKELAEGTEKLKIETDKLADEIFTLDLDNLTAFAASDENPRILAAANDQEMNRSVGLFAGTVILSLFAYVISVFVIHQINRESSVIGTLYAMGAKRRELLLHYITLPTIVTFAGGLVGTAAGFSALGIKRQLDGVYAYFSLPEFNAVYPPYLIVYAVVMPPVISIIVNSLVINSRLSRTALSLIKNEQRTSKLRAVELKGNNFVRNFRIRQMLREIRTSIAVTIGMFVSLLIFMLGLNCAVLCANVKKDTVSSTKFEYMYTLKYPPKTAPEGAEICYSESLSKTELGSTLDVTLFGIGDSKYFNAEPKKGKNGIVIGNSTATKYGLGKGDKLILSDVANDMDYVFTVEGICDYSAGLAVFMDIGGMRELFGREDGYYNTLLSDKPLDIDEGRLYSVNSRADIERSSAVFTEMMSPMVTMMISVSVLIFFAVIYLMTGVMIDRSSFGISLIKIFGFRAREIRGLYLGANTLTVAVGSLVCIPLAKLTLDALYPQLVANVGSGMNIGFPWYYYALIFAGVMAVYFIANALLTRKINGITPAEVLKNRE